jgi:hypothetical protein
VDVRDLQVSRRTTSPVSEKGGVEKDKGSGKLVEGGNKDSAFHLNAPVNAFRTSNLLEAITDVNSEAIANLSSTVKDVISSHKKVQRVTRDIL